LLKGIVDSYSEQKGFGFIIQDNGKKLSFERSSINMPGYKALAPNDQVIFDVKETMRGPEAMNVTKL
jgi:CspA family cold shock protein